MLPDEQHRCSARRRGERTQQCDADPEFPVLAVGETGEKAAGAPRTAVRRSSRWPPLANRLRTSSRSRISPDGGRSVIGPYRRMRRRRRPQRRRGEASSASGEARASASGASQSSASRKSSASPAPQPPPARGGGVGAPDFPSPCGRGSGERADPQLGMPRFRAAETPALACRTSRIRGSAKPATTSPSHPSIHRPPRPAASRGASARSPTRSRPRSSAQHYRPERRSRCARRQRAHRSQRKA